LFPPPAVLYDSGIPKSGVMKTAPSPQKAPTVQHVADSARDARDLKQSNALKQALTVH
jgi:hypothetical protein